MHYKPKVSTLSSVENVVIGVSYGFGGQMIDTFHAAFTFTLGLLTHELVKEWSHREWDNSKFFSWLIFMILGFIKPKIKQWYNNGDNSRNNLIEQNMPVTTSVNSSGQGSAHHGFYKT